MSIMSALKGLFGSDEEPAVKVSRPATPKEAKLKDQEEFKTAVREGDTAKMEDLLASQRIALNDELTGGRGLLQFAVMAKSVKAVRLLVARGADAKARDTLGASAETLAKKLGIPALSASLQPA